MDCKIRNMRSMSMFSHKELEALPSISCISMDQDDADDATMLGSDENIINEMILEEPVGTMEMKRVPNNISDLLCCSTTGAMNNQVLQSDLPYIIDSFGGGCFASWSTSKQKNLERNICDFLSAPSSHDQNQELDEKTAAFENKYWVTVQDRINCMQESLSTDEAGIQPEVQKEQASDYTRVFRTDMGMPRARYNRMRRLRRRMTLEPSLDDVVLSDTDSFLLKRVQSVDEHAPTRLQTPPRFPLPSVNEGLNVFRMQDMYCGNLSQVQSPPPSRSTSKSQLLDSLRQSRYPDDGYDSDPETMRATKGLFRDNKGSNDRETTSTAPKPPIHALTDSFESTDSKKCDPSEGSDRNYIDVFDDKQVTRVIEEFVNDTMTLIWHPAPKHGSDAPTCVRAWIELGCRLKTQVIQPKLVWRHAYATESDATQQNRRLAGPPEVLGQVELLDIARILTPDTIDRSEFPFAKPSKSFLVVTSDRRSLLFEVAEESERHRIVNGLKLLVSRLASMIIVGDPQLFSEFFHLSTPLGATRRRNDMVFGTVLGD